MKIKLTVTLFCLSLFLITFNTQACEEVAQLTKISGQVQVFITGKPFPLKNIKTPHSLCQGDKVQTAKSSKALIAHEQNIIVLSESSRLEITNNSQTNLAGGTALFKVNQLAGQKFTTSTPLTVIGVKGTEYLLTSQNSRDDIALYQGKISASRQDNQEMAHFKAKPVSQMTFQEYQHMQQQAFNDYKKQIKMDFEDYKKQQLAELESYKKSIELTKNKQLTLNSSKPEALETEVSDAAKSIYRELNRWQK